MRKLIFAALTVALAAAAVIGASTGGAKTTRAAAPASADTQLITCGKTRSIGLLAPITGAAASLGATQRSWFQYFVIRYNATHKTKLRTVVQDTKLPVVSEAVKAAQAVQSDPKVLGVVGPAGSQEVVGTTPTLKSGGLGFVSGSATRTTLTQESVRRGYFFRVVPPDALQSRDVANYIVNVLKAKRVYIVDDQEAYGVGLSDEVQAKLKARGVTVTRDSANVANQSDFSAIIAKIPRNIQVIYIPWQLPPKGQAFGRQLKSAGKATIKLFGSDGLFDPAFSGVGSNVYDSFFPVQPSSAIIKAYKRSHSGRGDFFGAPTYVAAQVVAGAIDRACKNGTASRAEVRAQIRKTNLRKTLLGLGVRFTAGGDIRGGKFGIYRSLNGQFARVG